MGSITIHEIDGALNARLAAEARRRHTSKNALIKEILAEKMGMPVNGAYSDDYREFVGLWTAEEAEAFARTQDSNAAIDPGDWE